MISPQSTLKPLTPLERLVCHAARFIELGAADFDDESAERLAICDAIREARELADLPDGLRLELECSGFKTIQFNRPRFRALILFLLRMAARSVGDREGTVRLSISGHRRGFELRLTDDGDGSFGLEMYFVEQIVRYYEGRLTVQTQQGANTLGVRIGEPLARARAPGSGGALEVRADAGISGAERGAPLAAGW